MKHILMVCHDFAPTMVGGVIRPLKFAKYLPETGWLPIVLTHDNPAPLLKDETLIEELPDSVQVIYTPPYVSEKFVKWVRRRDMRAQPFMEKDAPMSSKKILSMRRVWSVGFGIIRKYIEVPDRAYRWKQIALKEAENIFRSKKIDAIYTTSPPQSAHLIGLALKKKYNIPWVADFRDHWVGNISFYPHLKNPYRCWRESRMERKVVESADRVISVTEPSTENFKTRYPTLKHKFATLPNGFDGQDFQKADSVSRDQKFFRLRSFGSVGGGRNPKTLLHALNMLRENELWQYLKVEFFGLFGYDQKQWIEALGDKLSFVRSIPHKRVPQEMRKAGALLVFQCEGSSANFAVPGKLYECGRAGVPVIGIVEGGPTKDIIEIYRLGWACYSEDPSAISRAILSAYQVWKNKTSHSPSPKFFADFDRHHHTKLLADLLSVITSV